MREIRAGDVSALISRLYQEANFDLPADVISALKSAVPREQSPLGRRVLKTLIDNAEIAGRRRVPLCQDTGVAVVFLELGQDVHVVGGSLKEAVDEGVARAHREGHLRASVVNAPGHHRRNTGNNAPAILHVDMAPGDGFTATVLPKGAGSENMSRLGMLKPGAGETGIVNFVVESVERAGANPCPPIFLGIGIGGTMDWAALLSKRALLRPAGSPSSKARLARLEEKILEAVNALGIGPGGLGGTVTCLGAAIEEYPSHIASLPVAVNLQCNSNRRARGSL